MSLFATTVTVWNTKKPGNRLRLAYCDEFILNTNRITEMQLVGTDDSQFLYSDDPDDRRDSPGFIECVTSPTAITAYHDGVAESKFADLDIYPDMDITATPVTHTIEWDDIAYIYQTYHDIGRTVSHMVYYAKAWERIECIIDHTPVGVIMQQNLS